LDLFGKPQFPVLENTELEATEKLIERANDDKTGGIEFTEVMTGFIHIGDEALDFEVATEIAKSECENARFFLSVKSWDIRDRKLLPSRSQIKANASSGLE
jgi:hypothetical protein